LRHTKSTLIHKIGNFSAHIHGMKLLQKHFYNTRVRTCKISTKSKEGAFNQKFCMRCVWEVFFVKGGCCANCVRHAQLPSARRWQYAAEGKHNWRNPNVRRRASCDKGREELLLLRRQRSLRCTAYLAATPAAATKAAKLDLIQISASPWQLLAAARNSESAPPRMDGAARRRRLAASCSSGVISFLIVPSL
jgi:hypothetical protein